MFRGWGRHLGGCQDETRCGTVTLVQEQLSRAIRVAMVTGDIALLSEVVSNPGVEQHLQAAGEALLSLRERRATMHDEACQRVAAHLAAMLELRGWTGDGELAALLRDDTGTGARRRIRADLDEVADLLEGSLEMGFGGVLDMQTGSAWPEAVLDDWSLEDPRPDPNLDSERYLFIPNEGSRDAWQEHARLRRRRSRHSGARAAARRDRRQGRLRPVQAPPGPPRRPVDGLGRVLHRSPVRSGTSVAARRRLRRPTSPAVAPGGPPKRPPNG
jgi:hypothetical protein